MRVKWICVASVITCAAAFAQAPIQAPVVLEKVQPDYSDVAAPRVVDRVPVELVLTASGNPLSVKVRAGSLPDAVVNALSRWKFRPAMKEGKPVAVEIGLTALVERSVTPFMLRGFRREWHASDREIADRGAQAAKLDAEQVTTMEQMLAASPDDVPLRSELIVYYASAPSDRAADSSRRALEHIEYLVRKHPDAEILGSPLATINATENTGNTDARDRLRKLWLDAVAAHTADKHVMNNATNALRLYDPEILIKLLDPAVRNYDAEASVWLGDALGLAAAGVTAIDPRTGLVAAAAKQIPASGFGRQAQERLLAATDPRFLFSGIAAYTGAGGALRAAGHLPDGYDRVCAQLIMHARQVYSSYTGDCEINIAQAGNPYTRIRVGGAVQAANLVHKVVPKYPEAAKAQGIQGTIQFHVVIGVDGHLSEVELVSGPFALYQSARESVLQWHYKPTMLNGKPVEVVTLIDVNYQLR